MNSLSSRERMLTALRCQEPDHVPLVFKSFGFRPPPHLAWSNQYEEAEAWLSIGADAWLEVAPPLHHHPDVTVRDWEERSLGARWPVMVREYETPAGVLRQEVYRTDDWITDEWPEHKGGDSGVRLLDDYNVPRYHRPLIRSEQDLERLEYLFYPLSDEAIAGFREHAASVAAQVETLGVILTGTGVFGADVATWLCGAEGMVMMALDHPDLFDALLDLIYERDMRVLEVLLETPVDFILIRGYYQGTTFWSPTLYRRFFAPRIKELVNLIHEGGRLAGYIMSIGLMPLLNDFVEIGYDAHYLLDPIEHGVRIDLRRAKAAFEGRIAVIGGINDPVTLEQGTRDQIRQEVFDAVSILGPGGGLALTPAEAIMAVTPWESIDILMEAWREVRDYPIAV